MSDTTLRHIAIIMDGNNRWAKARGLPGPSGHKVGVERIRDVLSACKEVGAQAMTVFAFSSENWRRPAKEVDILMTLFLSYLKKEAKKLADQDVKLRIVGNRSRFSEKIQKAMAEAESLASNGSFHLNICADYGGRWDITEAAKALALQVARGELDPEAIDEQELAKHVCMADLPEPDLLIRTSGEQRISNFLLWQCAYSEFVFSDKLWPDFAGEDLKAAVAEFNSRQRRFGKTAEQIAQEGDNA